MGEVIDITTGQELFAWHDVDLDEVISIRITKGAARVLMEHLALIEQNYENDEHTPTLDNIWRQAHRGVWPDSEL
jgi:hypothetical protein